MQFVDAAPVAETRRTADGYLIATAKSVRTGIQHYAGHECGMADKEVVRVYRSPEEVFAQDSLQSFSHAPITIDHPTEPVTSENVKRLAVGEVSTAAHMDGKWVSLPLILKDAGAIRSLESGKRQLSAGYTCTIDPTPGITADGEPFDARQVGIKINHLALVDKARAGDEARIGDGGANWGAAPISTMDKETVTMSDALRTVVVDGLSVQTTDQGAQAITKLQKDLEASAAKLADAEKVSADAIKAKDEELAKKDAALDDAKGKILSDADLDKRVQARADLIATAKTIAKDVDTAGKSDAEIRKAVVVAKLGDAAIKDKSEHYVDARFDILADEAAKNADPMRKVLGDSGTGSAGTGSDNVVKLGDSQTEYQRMLDRDAAAWQKGA